VGNCERNKTVFKAISAAFENRMGVGISQIKPVYAFPHWQQVREAGTRVLDFYKLLSAEQITPVQKTWEVREFKCL
jgi:hypothetical protein